MSASLAEYIVMGAGTVFAFLQVYRYMTRPSDVPVLSTDDSYRSRSNYNPNNVTAESNDHSENNLESEVKQ